MSRKNGIIETFTELAPRYESTLDSELSKFWGWRYSDFVDHLIRMTPIQQSDIILDVATGTALIPRKISNLINKNGPIHGLDITPAMLERAKGKIDENNLPDRFRFVCASAMSMPYTKGAFDVVLCGLATHHMDVHVMLSEMSRVLRDGGELAIADVGGSPWWNFPGIKFLIKILAFIYYSFQENLKRAWAETQGVSNIRSAEEWYDLLHETGFEGIKISRLRSKFPWFPQPMLIRSNKKTTGE
jgi:ubiquinone/menaquinone biosynthesis C-methylase UbiE